MPPEDAEHKVGEQRRPGLRRRRQGRRVLGHHKDHAGGPRHARGGGQRPHTPAQRQGRRAQEDPRVGHPPQGRPMPGRERGGGQQACGDWRVGQGVPQCEFLVFFSWLNFIKTKHMNVCGLF